jgi:hypothetical protein
MGSTSYKPNCALPFCTVVPATLHPGRLRAHFHVKRLSQSFSSPVMCTRICSLALPRDNGVFWNGRCLMTAHILGVCVPDSFKQAYPKAETPILRKPHHSDSLRLYLLAGRTNKWRDYNLIREGEDKVTLRPRNLIRGMQRSSYTVRETRGSPWLLASWLVCPDEPSL